MLFQFLCDFSDFLDSSNFVKSHRILLKDSRRTPKDHFETARRYLRDPFTCRKSDSIPNLVVINVTQEYRDFGANLGEVEMAIR